MIFFSSLSRNNSPCIVLNSVLIINFSYLIFGSEVFTEGSQKKLVDGRSIKAFGLFKRGIKPEWEDSANQGGCELTAVKSFQFEVLDIYWENLVLGLIGQTFEEGNEICGCRVVDQTKRARPLYKLELWLRVADPPVVNKIKAKLGEILIDGENSKTNRLKAPEFDLVLRK